MPRALTPRFAPERPGMRCARFDGESCAPVTRLSRAIATICGAPNLGQTQYLAPVFHRPPCFGPELVWTSCGNHVQAGVMASRLRACNWRAYRLTRLAEMFSALSAR